MRFVIFGVPGPATEALQQPAVRSLVALLHRGDAPGSVEVPALAVTAGLVVRTPTGLRVGPAVVPAPPVAEQAVRHAAGRAAAAIRELLPAIRYQLGGVPDGTGPVWPSAGLLVVGGVLLDLCVGEELRLRGVVDDPAGPRVWLLPDAPAVSVGMQCVYSDRWGVGAGSMWVSPGHAAPQLPDPADLGIVTNGVRIGGDLALASLRLRYGGWLDGAEPRFLLLSQDAGLWPLLSAAATELVRTVYRPVLDDPIFTDRGHSRLVASRLILEHTLAALLATGALPSPPTGLAQRLVWIGPNWRLAQDETVASAVRATRAVQVT